MTAPKKTPQDHKKPTADDGSVTRTAWGRDWTISAEALDDWDLLEDLASGDASRAPSAVRALLGAEQYVAAKDIARDETGRVRATRMSQFMAELFAGDVPNG